MPGTRSSKRASVGGAGVGGLAAAIELAAEGFAIDLCERAAAPGSKLREVAIGWAHLDAGPSHERLSPDRFTLGWVQDMLPFRLPRVI